MRTLKYFALGLLALIGTLGAVHSQSQYLPIPEGVCASANQILTAVNANNVQCSSSAALSTIAASTSLTVGSGTAITKIAVYSQELSSGSVAANSCSERAFTVTGISTSDKVFGNGPELLSGGAAAKVRVVGMRHSGANTLAVTFCNVSTQSDIMPSGTFSIVALRS